LTEYCLTLYLDSRLNEWCLTGLRTEQVNLDNKASVWNTAEHCRTQANRREFCCCSLNNPPQNSTNECICSRTPKFRMGNKKVQRPSSTFLRWFTRSILIYICYLHLGLPFPEHPTSKTLCSHFLYVTWLLKYFVIIIIITLNKHHIQIKLSWERSTHFYVGLHWIYD
jgi:hypothetical protein